MDLSGGHPPMLRSTMPRTPEIPEALRHGPFTRTHALEAGLTSRQLQGRSFRRVLPGVWAVRDVLLTDLDMLRAADLATPSDARLSHLSRIQAMGLDIGAPSPVHLTIARDHHLRLPGVFLHRAVRMPPIDDVGVTPAAAFLGAATDTPTIEMVAAGDWLLRHGHAQAEEIRALARRDLWRPGAAAAAWLTRRLDPRSRSLPESRLRCMMIACGLPHPEVNVPISDDPRSPIADLYLRRWRTAVEYEGGQHFTDRAQMLRDIGRYAVMRGQETAYVQVTAEMMGQPRGVMHSIVATLRRQGYDGPDPVFGREWELLFEPATAARVWSSDPGADLRRAGAS